MAILQEDGLERKGTDKNNPAISNEHEAIGKPLPASWARTVAGEEETSPECVYEASRRLVAAGLSVIPIEACEGSKAPDTRRLPHPHDVGDGRPRASWSVYKMRRPNADELRGWYAVQGSYGLAVVGGAVSGGANGQGLEIIDLDTAALVQPWKEAVERQAPGLVDRLVRIKTPRPGLHVYYRCSPFGVSQKLACAPAVDHFGHQAVDACGKPGRKTLIEVKAEGGYCLIPPSPPRCHPSCRLYQYAEDSPDLTAVPTITPEERAILLDAARSLNQWQEVKPVSRRTKRPAKTEGVLLPGDDFNARADWTDILTPHGWTCTGAYGEVTRWCRPGKYGGISATTNYQDNDLLHVFSSNAAPLEADRSYAKFAAYVWLNHGGDFVKGARELRDQGYGRKEPNGKRVVT